MPCLPAVHHIIDCIIGGILADPCFEHHRACILLRVSESVSRNTQLPTRTSQRVPHVQEAYWSFAVREALHRTVRKNLQILFSSNAEAESERGQ